MGKWILQHAPDLAPAVEAGTHAEKVTPLYHRLKREYADAVGWLLQRTGDLRSRGHRMVMDRRDRKFVAGWDPPAEGK